MSGGVNLVIRALIEGYVSAVEGVVPNNGNVYFDQDIPFLTGNGVNQADTVYSQALALGPSGTETLDLLTGLTDALGMPVALARCKAIIVVVGAAGGSVTLAGGASNPFLGPLGGTTPTVTTNPGGLTALVAPDATAWAVASGTANLKLTNNSSTLGATGTIYILGASS